MNRDSAQSVGAAPVIYPLPRQMDLLDKTFLLNERAVILVPESPSENDVFLAQFLTAELTDRYQVAVQTERTAGLPAHGRFILMGTHENPLVKALCAKRGATVGPAEPGPEGYVLDVAEDGVLIAGCDKAGALYGLQSLRQLIAPDNRLVIEMNAAMRLDRHPELNAGWYELAKSMNYTRRSRPEGPGRQFQDSTHHDTGDFGIVEKDEVADIVRYARQHGMDVIPEIPSLTHAYYLLTRHREFAEIQKAEWPDTYCPCMPEVYELYLDVLDEYIEVIRPSVVHIGHDEWRMPMDVCPRCKGKDYRELFVQDVNKVHDHLEEKGVRTAMWGDHLLERVRGGEGGRETVTAGGYEFRQPGALSPEQVEKDIPKDILIFNWFWNAGSRVGAEANGIQVAEWGFEQVYGNFTPAITDQNYAERSARKGVLGGAASSWVATTEANFGKDLLNTFVGCAGLLWSEEWLPAAELTRAIQALMPAVRRNLVGVPTPTQDGEPVTAVDISSAFTNIDNAMDLLGDLGKLGSGLVAIGTHGQGESALPLESSPIPINEDPSSLLFLHACARPAGRIAGHSAIYNFDDCADLLGWYEVTYEDGFVVTVPIRYGLNILEWSWGRAGESRGLCYQADPFDCAEEGVPPITFFAFEWINPRFGKVIKEVRLKGSRNFIDAHGKPIPSNAVMLLALSLVNKRPGPESTHVKEDF